MNDNNAVEFDERIDQPDPGDLIEIIDASDQGLWIKHFIEKTGIIIEHIKTNSSPNIWKILMSDSSCYNFHRLDFKIIKKGKINDNNGKQQ